MVVAGADGGFQINARTVQNSDMLDNGEPQACSAGRLGADLSTR